MPPRAIQRAEDAAELSRAAVRLIEAITRLCPVCPERSEAIRRIAAAVLAARATLDVDVTEEPP